jgi:hypothetical protein
MRHASETPVGFQLTTSCYIPEDRTLHEVCFVSYYRISSKRLSPTLILARDCVTMDMVLIVNRILLYFLVQRVTALHS